MGRQNNAVVEGDLNRRSSADFKSEAKTIAASGRLLLVFAGRADSRQDALSRRFLNLLERPLPAYPAGVKGIQQSDTCGGGLVGVS